MLYGSALTVPRIGDKCISIVRNYFTLPSFSMSLLVFVKPPTMYPPNFSNFCYAEQNILHRNIWIIFQCYTLGVLLSLRVQDNRFSYLIPSVSLYIIKNGFGLASYFSKCYASQIAWNSILRLNYCNIGFSVFILYNPIKFYCQH